MYGQPPTPSCGASIAALPSPTVCSGTTLTANPAGTRFFYQWRKDGVNIPNANQRTYPLEESGSYTVIVRSATCAADTSDAVAVTVNKEEAKFSIEERIRIQPQSADTCGIPVKVTLKNESTPETGLTYTWEITDSKDEKVDSKVAKFLDGTTASSANPILQFNQKGQYTIRLRIKGACFDPTKPDGPADAVDPDNPDKESDGRYVHEEQVTIVYPQVSPQTISECEDLSPTATPFTINGAQLVGSQDGKLDYNLGTQRPGSIEWKIISGTGGTISDPKIENPVFTFPRKGSYVVTLRYANECEFSDALNGITQFNIDFTPRPPKPILPLAETYVCAGGTYELSPTPSQPNRMYNFYANETSNRPLNTSGPTPSYFAGPVNGRTVLYVAAFENGCESLERTMFTINTIQEDIDNTISAPDTICEGTKPAALSGTNVRVGSLKPTYLWESKAVGASEFSAAAGTNNQQSYSPQELSETTIFRRTVSFEGCDTPNLSNEITIEVLPVIEPSENVISVDKKIVCRGDEPTFSGNLLNGDIEYQWQSSTTSATTGFVAARAADGSDNKNGASFTPEFVTQKTWFRRVAKYKGTNCDFVPSSESILIEIDELPQAPSVTSADVRTCQGSSAVLEVQPATGSNLTYIWYTDKTGGEPIGAGTSFTTPALTQNTTFYVEAENENKCVSTSRTPVRVTVAPFSASAGNDTTVIAGQSLQLRATGGGTYKWTPATGLSNPDIANPVVTTPDNVTDITTITYTVTVSNGTGCEATDEITITIIPRIKIVNTFSPNGDGFNELWEIQYIENYPEATVEIFNRYGAQVYKSPASGYQPWDGKQNGNTLPLATYYYIIRLNKNERPFTGSITIIK
ncbi:gliding motility-associated C-terminal domain-containing protein [Rufibacter glacialis]|nr:gliding motility-associated C-terminal domain-containing protein [Rufibacter glacialis]